MSMISHNNSSELAKWDDWGRRRCDDASKAGLLMVGGGILARNSNLTMAGILVSIFPQLIKETFFPQKIQG